MREATPAIIETPQIRALRRSGLLKLFSTCSGNPGEVIEKYLKDAEGLPIVLYLKALEQMGAEWTSRDHFGPPQPGDIRCRVIVLQARAAEDLKRNRLTQFHERQKAMGLNQEKALEWCRQHAPNVEERGDLTEAAAMRRLAHLDPPLKLGLSGDDADEWRLENAPQVESMRRQG